jgi:hypothetical protein
MMEIVNSSLSKIEQYLLDLKTQLCQLPKNDSGIYIVTQASYQNLFDHVDIAISAINDCLLKDRQEQQQPSTKRLKMEDPDSPTAAANSLDVKEDNDDGVADDSNEEEVEADARSNLKQLIKWICTLPIDKAFQTSFDVLRGYPAEHYGLCPKDAGKWTKELALILLKCPQFQAKMSPEFFARLFHEPINKWSWKLRNLHNFLDDERSQKVSSKTSRLMAELLSDNWHEKQEEDLETKPIPTPIMPTSINPCVDWLSANRNGVISVACQRRPFAAREIYHHKAKVIPEMKIQHAVAILGLCIEETDDISVPKVTGRILVQSCHSTNFSVTQDFESLFLALRQSFQVSQQDMFRNTEPYSKKQLGGNGAFLRKIKWKEKRAVEQMPQDQLVRLHVEYVLQAEPLLARKKHNVVHHKLPQSFHIQLLDCLGLDRLNNMCLLMGDDLANLSVQCLLTEPLSTFKGQTQTYSQRQLCRAFTEFYRYLANIELRDLPQQVPFYHEQFTQLREVLSLLRIYKDFQEKENRQCPNCGKVFRWSKNSTEVYLVTKHLKECNLEHSNCECRETFKSPADKRRHMLIKHSGSLYFECNHCPFITKSQATLGNHIDYTHGVTGVEEVCDLCYKSFK